MDNAPYHSKRLYPLKSDTKRTLYDWLKQYETDPELHFTLPEYNKIQKWELEQLLAQVITKKKMAAELFVVDKLAKEKGFQILHNALYHCFFSPIEYCWKDVKHEVRKQNVDENINTLRPIVEEILRNYPADIMKKHFDHVKRLEQDYWDQDGTFDDQPEIQPIVISRDQSDDEDGPEANLDDFSECNDFSSDRTTEDVEFQTMDGSTVSDDEEHIETDRTIHLDDGCTPQLGFEDEMAEFMATRPAKRPRLNPMCISQDLY